MLEVQERYDSQYFQSGQQINIILIHTTEHIISMYLPANRSLVTSYVYCTVPDSHNHHPLLLYFVSTRVTI